MGGIALTTVSGSVVECYERDEELLTWNFKGRGESGVKQEEMV